MIKVLIISLVVLTGMILFSAIFWTMFFQTLDRKLDVIAERFEDGE